MERWNGRVALVTGASVGIGAGLCRALVQHGMVVIGCARSVEKIRAIAEEDAVKAAPGKLVAIKCDISQETEILSLFSEIRQKFGRLDVCINNAGLSHDSPLVTGNTSDWKNMLDVNIMGLCICTQEAVKLMQEKGIDDGQIIHLSSIGASSRSKIRIASISPGIVETEFFDRYEKENPSKKAPDMFSSMQALQAKDIADSVLYILSAPQHVEVHDIIVRPYDQPT
ncbi:hypothetical protein CEXT_428211 [Caerostris extrusa]|uniref:Dehydrogenase/reductase SDR family member 11 n=1 Tax=Caerostris extrusa TaxID=172846 RepID=A0AAV4PZD2_CAEEX|nr:hypothetical protein CEXT_428211 [Caerostris extrusa]